MSALDDLGFLQGFAEPLRLTEGITNRQLSIILKEASYEAEQFILATAGTTKFSTMIRREQLKTLKAGIDQISTELWTKTGKVTQVGMFAQAQLAADQALDRDIFLGMPGRAALQYARAMHIDAAIGVESILSRRTEGFRLADAIYAHGRQTTTQVGRIIEQGLAQQWSAKELARATRMHFSPTVPGGTSYASMRLARTEINNAHHSTTIRMSNQRPWVLGYHWNLSDSHPRPDECNFFAERDDDGLGAGNYKKEHAPSRPHPQCLCFLTHIQEPEDVFVDKLISGGYDDFLAKHQVTCL